jgi:hypothetical protein
LPLHLLQQVLQVLLLLRWLQLLSGLLGCLVWQ